jgi:peptidoglycan hydrolase-like protein with peptidoglycan-binding domain
MKKFIFSTVLGLALVAGNMASAQTSQSMVLPRVCYVFSKYLQVGSRGEDVKQLQVLLNQSSDTQVALSGAGSPGNETTYFGPATLKAIIKFQEKHSIEVLAPAGLIRGTGFVGRLTLAKLNKLCDGTGTPHPITPVSYSINTDKTIYNSSDTITITLKATNTASTSQTLSFTNGCQTSFTIGEYDSIRGLMCTMSLGNITLNPGESKIWTMTHDLSARPLNVGTYTLTGYVRNNGSAQTTIKILGSVITASNITVTSPNGGENWTQGTSYMITWQSPNVTYIQAPRFDLYLIPEPPACATATPVHCMIATPIYPIAQNVIGSAGLSSFTWSAGSVNTSEPVSIQTGSYRIKVCTAGGGSCDMSDTPFTLIVPGSVRY